MKVQVCDFCGEVVEVLFQIEEKGVCKDCLQDLEESKKEFEYEVERK